MGRPLAAEEVQRVAAQLMEYSLYAWEDELAQGFFTIEGGCRVGVAGRCDAQSGRVRRVADIQAVCIRIAREKMAALKAKKSENEASSGTASESPSGNSPENAAMAQESPTPAPVPEEKTASQENQPLSQADRIRIAKEKMAALKAARKAQEK